MAHTEFTIETSLSPEQVRRALTDFTERRPELWPDLSAKVYEVYSVGETSAEIREGTDMPGFQIWAHEVYDWSDPNLVEWKVKESNFSTPGDGLTARVESADGEGCRVHVTWDRNGRGFAGRFIVGMIAMAKGAPIRKGWEKSLKHLESMAGEL